MGYESIDPVIAAWATSHALHLSTHFRADEVRSVDLEGNNGHKSTLWIDVPDQSGTVVVHLWDYAKGRYEYHASARDLRRTLDEAYSTAAR